jgi:hypothetical protein
MDFRIQTNVSTRNMLINATATNDVMAKSLQMLASGPRVNSAADNASGLRISARAQAMANNSADATNMPAAASTYSAAPSPIRDADSVQLAPSSRQLSARSASMYAANAQPQQPVLSLLA